MAVSPVLLVVAVAALERRAPRTARLADLIGDLTIGTSAVLFLLSFLLGSLALVGPGVLLLLIGTGVFGVAGYFLGGRPAMASLVTGLGGFGVLFFLVLGATTDPGDAGSPAIFALLLFCGGWVWLGADLLLARPLVMPEQS